MNYCKFTWVHEGVCILPFQQSLRCKLLTKLDIYVIQTTQKIEFAEIKTNILVRYFLGCEITYQWFELKEKLEEKIKTYDIH